MTVWDIEFFIPSARYDASVESLVDHLHASAPRPGAGEVTLPGDRSAATRVQRRRAGIPLAPDVIDGCDQVAALAGVAPPRPKVAGRD
jgi:L-2-hydroxycarboxylate dehydrogenase (NAD+)